MSYECSDPCTEHSQITLLVHIHQNAQIHVLNIHKSLYSFTSIRMLRYMYWTFTNHSTRSHPSECSDPCTEHSQITLLVHIHQKNHSDSGGVETGEHVPPSQFFSRDQKCPFLWWEVPFCTNVAVNTILTSKVPFLFGNFHVFKTNLVKNVIRYGMTGRFLFCPQPQYFRGKFLRCPFHYPKVPWKPVPPPIFWCFPRPSSDLTSG
jgi:hypothetical protein